jgi:hypothetical protein
MPGQKPNPERPTPVHGNLHDLNGKPCGTLVATTMQRDDRLEADESLIPTGLER